MPPKPDWWNLCSSPAITGVLEGKSEFTCSKVLFLVANEVFRTEIDIHATHVSATKLRTVTGVPMFNFSLVVYVNKPISVHGVE